jgi:hypothetical protein
MVCCFGSQDTWIWWGRGEGGEEEEERRERRERREGEEGEERREGEEGGRGGSGEEGGRGGRERRERREEGRAFICNAHSLRTDRDAGSRAEGGAHRAVDHPFVFVAVAVDPLSWPRINPLQGFRLSKDSREVASGFEGEGEEEREGKRGRGRGRRRETRVRGREGEEEEEGWEED